MISSWTWPSSARCSGGTRPRGKTFLLTALAPDWPLEVRDPYAQHDSVFQASYEHIAASVGPIARLLPAPGVAE